MVEVIMAGNRRSAHREIALESDGKTDPLAFLSGRRSRDEIVSEALDGLREDIKDALKGFKQTENA
jgi:hypothetical protein